MRFTGIPQVDAWNYYQERRNRGSSRVVHLQNGGGYEVRLKNNDRLCTFSDFSDSLCILRVNPKYNRFISEILCIVSRNGLSWSQVRDGILLEDSEIDNKYRLQNHIQYVAGLIRNKSDYWV